MDYPVLVPKDGSMVIDIPFPYKQFVDTQFFLTDTSQGKRLFIPDDAYRRIDDYRIEIMYPEDYDLTDKSEIRFTFIHQKNKRWIGKKEYHMQLSEDGEREFSLPDSPYNETLNLSKRMYVFYNRVRQRPGIHYVVHSVDGKLYILNKDLEYKKEDKVDVMIVYTGHPDNYAIQELPESGYIYLNANDIDRNYSKDRTAVFVDGKLLDRSQLIRISNTVYKVSEDIGTRYDLDVRSLSPRVDSLVPYYRKVVRVPELPPQKYNFHMPSRIQVPNPIPHNRPKLSGDFNPIYFDPELVNQPNLWITLIRPGVNHRVNCPTLKYYWNLYGNDLEDNPLDKVYVILQLRIRGERELADDSRTSILCGTLDGSMKQQDQDIVIASTQVKTVLRQDIWNGQYGIDGILGKLQADPKKYDTKIPLHYDFNSNRFEIDNEVCLLEWTVSSEPDAKGEVYWRKHICLVPENKSEILAQRGDEIDGW